MVQVAGWRREWSVCGSWRWRFQGMWGNEMGVVQAKMAGAWAKLFRLEVLFRAFLLLSDLLIPNLLILNQLFHHSLFWKLTFTPGSSGLSPVSISSLGQDLLLEWESQGWLTCMHLVPSLHFKMPLILLFLCCFYPIFGITFLAFICQEIFSFLVPFIPYHFFNTILTSFFSYNTYHNLPLEKLSV